MVLKEDCLRYWGDSMVLKEDCPRYWGDSMVLGKDSLSKVLGRNSNGAGRKHSSNLTCYKKARNW